MYVLPDNDPRKLALSQEEVQMALLVRAQRVGQSADLWSCSPYPITLKGTYAGTYTRNRALRVASVPDEKGSLRRTRYGMEFSDPDHVYVNYFNVGTHIVVMAAFRIDKTKFHDVPFIVFRGRCSGGTWEVSEERGPVCSVAFVGPLGWQTAFRAMYMTADDQKRRNPMDNAFDRINVDRTRKWVGI